MKERVLDVNSKKPASVVPGILVCCCRYLLSSQVCRIRTRPLIPSRLLEGKLGGALICRSVRAVFAVVINLSRRSEVVTGAARGRRLCPRPQEPKLLGGTLIAISSHPTTALLFHDRRLV